MEKILLISLKLTPNTLGCYGLMFSCTLLLRGLTTSPRGSDDGILIPLRNAAHATEDAPRRRRKGVSVAQRSPLGPPLPAQPRLVQCSGPTSHESLHRSPPPVNWNTFKQNDTLVGGSFWDGRVADRVLQPRTKSNLLVISVTPLYLLNSVK